LEKSSYKEPTSKKYKKQINLENAAVAPIPDWKAQKNRLMLLNEIGLAVTQMLDLKEILDYAETLLVQRFGIAVCIIYIWDEELKDYQIRRSHGINITIENEINRKRRKGDDFVRDVARTKESIFIPRMDLDERLGFEIRKKYPDHYYYGFPLISRSMVIGVIELMSPELPRYEEENVYFLEMLGREIGVAIDNAILVSKAKKQQEEALNLYKLGTRISSSLILSEVLEAVAESARTLLNSDVGFVGLYEESCQEVKIEEVSGVGSKKLEGLSIHIINESIGRSLYQGEVSLGCNSCDQDEETIAWFRENLEDYVSFLAIPLHLGDHFLGVIGVLSKDILEYNQTDIRLLKQLGYHVFVAIENARLHQHLRFATALEEQNRLAREIHDNLAQAMAYVKIKAMMSSEMLNKGDLSKAKMHLDELVRTTRVLYTDIREDIFNLRNTDPSRLNFMDALQQYLTEYERNYGVEVRLTAEESDRLDLDLETANHLMRIIQEALSNVRKHAHAENVSIDFWCDSGLVKIKIEDDGVGFDLAAMEKNQIKSQSYGLQIMHERACQINGNLIMESNPGKGTRILVSVPNSRWL